MTLRRYRRRSSTHVTAVQIDLDTEGFTYQKWGGLQRCTAGDWLVCNAGNTYTVEQESFARTYEPVSPGVYRKCAPVWAEQAAETGRITTKEGQSDYSPGDFLVYNDPQRHDGYAMSATEFERLYTAEDDPSTEA